VYSNSDSGLGIHPLTSALRRPTPVENCNLFSDFFWSSVSDYLGRKTTFSIFFVLGVLLYWLLPSSRGGRQQE
jgi:hypothetical protein